MYQKKNEKISELKIGDNIIVIGDPESNGRIMAKLIRVMPPLPSNLPPNKPIN